MLIALIITLYLLIAFFTYEFAVKNWNHKMWEKIVIALFWPTIIPLWIIHKINEWAQ